MRLNRALLFSFLFAAGCAPPPQKQLRAIIVTAEPAQSVHEVSAERPRAEMPLITRNATPGELAAGVRFLESLTQLEKLRRVYPERHEVIFNEAVLLHEYGYLLGPENQGLVLREAMRMYRLFIRQAETDPDARGAVHVAKDRLSELDDATTCHFGPSEFDRKAMETEEKQRAAEEEIRRGDEVDTLLK